MTLVLLNYPPYQHRLFSSHGFSVGRMNLDDHQPSCDVSPRVQNQRVGYAACDFGFHLCSQSEGALHHDPSVGCYWDYRLDCGVGGRGHDHWNDRGCGDGPGYGRRGGHRDLDKICRSGDESARESGSERVMNFLWGMVSGRNCGNGWI